jgi:hypothetical protein
MVSMNTEIIKKRYSHSKTFCGLHDGIFGWSRRLDTKENMSIFTGIRLGCEWKNGLFRAEYEIDGKYKYEFTIKDAICDICDKISKSSIFNENSENINKELQRQLFVILWYLEILKRNGVLDQKDDFIKSEVMECHFMGSSQKRLILNTVISNYSEKYSNKQSKEVVNRI